MYRLLIFAILLNFAESRSWCRGPHCQSKSHHKEHGRNPEEIFYKLAHHAISTEKKFENFCKYNLHTRIREVYTPDSYVLKYSIPDFKAKDLVVKVLHKAIYIGAERRDPTGLKSFRDVKMLPDNLNSEEAYWHLQDEELEITFPYQTPMGTETRKSCGNVNYSIIVLPSWHPGSGGKGITDDVRIAAVSKE